MDKAYLMVRNDDGHFNSRWKNTDSTYTIAKMNDGGHKETYSVPQNIEECQKLFDGIAQTFSEMHHLQKQLEGFQNPRTAPIS
jgi:hypothetical protein